MADVLISLVTPLSVVFSLFANHTMWENPIVIADSMT